jgi:membrane-associated protein
MMATLLQLVAGLHGWPVYAIASAAAFLESAAFFGLVVPGETVMLIAGMLAAGGVVQVPALLLGVIVAAVLGDSVGYFIGSKFGPALMTSRLGRRIPRRHWDRAQEYLQRRGAIAVVLGRWVGILGALVPAMAGVVRMPYRRFLAANIVGAVTWSLVVVGLGYFAGASLAAAQSLLGTVTLYVLLALAALAAAMLLTDRLRKRHRGSRGPELEDEETVGDSDGHKALVRSESR